MFGWWFGTCSCFPHIGHNVGIAIKYHPPNHHFYGWYVHHQKWVVYGIAISTLIKSQLTIHMFQRGLVHHQDVNVFFVVYFQATREASLKFLAVMAIPIGHK